MTMRLFLQPLTCLACAKAYKPGSLRWRQGELVICHRCWEDLGWLRVPRCSYCGREEVQNKERRVIQGKRGWGGGAGVDGEQLCSDCAFGLAAGSKGGFVWQRSLLNYNRLNRQLLYRYKYWGESQLASLWAELLYAGFRRYYRKATRGLGGANFDWGRYDWIGAGDAGRRRRRQQRPTIQLLTFVPLHESRLYERGFNQVEELAKPLAQRLGLPLVPLLARVKATPKQSKQGRSERLQGLTDAFTALPLPSSFTQTTKRAKSIITPESSCQLLLLDDLYTTGATMEQCAAALQLRYPRWEIYGLTLIRA